MKSSVLSDSKRWYRIGRASQKITQNVVPDMQKLGIEVVNFNIQNFKDAAGTIENMGIDNVEQIRKMPRLPRRTPNAISLSPLPMRSRKPTPSRLLPRK